MPKQQESLLESDMQAAGVAAMSIDSPGAFDLVDNVGLDWPRDQLWLCQAACEHRRYMKQPHTVWQDRWRRSRPLAS